MNVCLMGWVGWALLTLLMIVALLAASGCSSTSSGVCAVQPIGQDEEGIAYFRYNCRPS